MNNISKISPKLHASLCTNFSTGTKGKVSFVCTPGNEQKLTLRFPSHSFWYKQFFEVIQDETSIISQKKRERKAFGTIQ